MKIEYRLIILLLVLTTPGLCYADSDAHVTASLPEATESDQKAATTTQDTVPSSKSVRRVVYDSELLGNLTSPSLREASGLALSTRSPNLAWSHNDSGYGPYLFVFNLKGEDRGRFYVQNAGSGDWEDMAAFKWQGQSWLLIADTGDNSSKKSSYTLYLVSEPEISPDRSPVLRPLPGVRRARIAFSTGPADTEAVAVDVVEQRVYLITKRERPAQVFSLPLSVFDDEKTVHVARFETELFSLPAPTLQEILEYPKLGLAFAQPNSMDFSPDRSFAVVHTYGHSYRFVRSRSQSWAQAFADAPEQFDVPLMIQSEAVAVGSDNRSLYYTSEGKRPPLYRLIPAASAD